jgi:hypothetical protein
MSFASDRRFRIWDYNVSHNQMLLRSPKSPDHSENIDIVFWGVEYIEIPSAFTGVELVKASTEEASSMKRIPEKRCETSDVHVLSSGGKKFVVVAAGFKVLRNDLDIFESSLEYFSGTDSPKDAGSLLAHS